MQQKQEKEAVEEQSLRYHLLPLFMTNVQTSLIPLHMIEVVLQFIPYLLILKFSIDYFTNYWLGNSQAIFFFLDASYYLQFASPSTYQLIFILSIVFMNIYWMGLLGLFLAGSGHGELACNLKKLAFIISRNVLLVPLFNLILNMYNCGYNLPFRPCYSNYSSSVQVVAIISFSLFALMVVGQTFFSFDFIQHRKEFRRIKRSSFMPVAIVGYLLLNEAVSYFLTDVTQLVVLDLSSGLLMVLFWLKEEQIMQRMRLIQLSFLGTNLLGLLMVNIVYFTSQDLSLLLFFFLSVFLVAGLMQVKTYSLKFQLENINKWTTSEVMIRYTNTLRYYLSRRQEYIFKVYIHGYMEMHRQKCDNPACPSRCDLSDSEKMLFEGGRLKKEDEQILRTENIVKKIYQDGYKLTPISAELQLQYSTFLYSLGQKELALKNLLLIKYQELSFDKYYRYYFLKQRIHRQMCEQPDKNFLDLVSELRVKREEDLILKLFQKAALINLEFWSILNEDHPDFQKLNQVGATRIQVRQQVRDTYRNICRIAHSEKITSLYVHYLEAIENDEDMYNEIYQGVKEEYALEKKIVLQDWANSSSAIMLVSIDQANHGTIIDINSSCASLFGYQRYQILNRHIKQLFTDDLKDTIKNFLAPNHEELFFMTHKTGYLVRLKRRSQNYNSMETGMASVITLNLQVNPNHCYFALDSSQKVFGVSSSIISLLGVEAKTFEGEVYAKDFFTFPIGRTAGEEQKGRKLSEILVQPCENDPIDYSHRVFRVACEEKENHWIVSLEHMVGASRKSKRKNSVPPILFEFQIQATLSTFKYFGSYSDHEAYITQFSQIQYAESLKQGHTTTDYSAGINTLRLRDNIIQVIEEIDQEQIEKYLVKNSELTSETENMARKDEEAVFQSKAAYEQFVGRFSFAGSVKYLFLAGMLAVLTLYVAYYFLFSMHYSAVQDLTSEIAYQNLIIGAIAKELSLLRDLQLMARGVSPDTASRFTKIYSDNINYLESIKLQGSAPYQISVSLGTANQTFLTDQFVLSFINYAIAIYANMSTANTTTQLISAFNTNANASLQYLLTNSQGVKEVMMAAAAVREGEIGQQMSSFIRAEILMLVGGVVGVGVFTIITLMVIHKVNKQRIRIFEIFLDISEIQIQQFSSKTEKFLLSLHVQDTNGEIDVDQQVQNTKKINSSTFAKKKRFKLVNFNKSIYFKLLLIPLFAVAFFVHSFVQSYSSLSFQQQSYHYFFLTSQGDYTFYSGLAQIQNALLTNSTPNTALSETYIAYYRNYFDLHFATFGYLNDFHQTFTDTFMLDTCNGTNSPFGSTQIIESCEIPLLSSNGSYLVFTDTAMNTEFFTNASSMTYGYLVGYEVLSKTHRLLTQDLLMAQQGLLDSTMGTLLMILLIWLLVMSAVSFLYGMPVMNRFVGEINQIKNILSILPISVARQLPLAPKYFNRILRAQQCC